MKSVGSRLVSVTYKPVTENATLTSKFVQFISSKEVLETNEMNITIEDVEACLQEDTKPVPYHLKASSYLVILKKIPVQAQKEEQNYYETGRFKRNRAVKRQVKPNNYKTQ